jgi:hypothetical protein
MRRKVPENPSGSDRQGVSELGRGVWDLVVGYLKQETLEPVKSLGRYVAFGTAGSIVGGIGLILVILAVLRVLQEDTGSTFAGAHSWMPYAVCAVLALVVVAMAALRIVRPARSPGGSK